MRGSRNKIPSKNSRPYIYIYTHVKFLALLGAPYIYDISRLRVKDGHELTKLWRDGWYQECSRTLLVYWFIRFARVSNRQFIAIHVHYEFKRSMYIQEPLVIGGIEYRNI
jgi:hypothetical protein